MHKNALFFLKIAKIAHRWGFTPRFTCLRRLGELSPPIENSWRRHWSELW